MSHRTAVILGSAVLAAATLTPPGHAAPGFISEVTTLTAHQSAGQYAVALAPDGTAHAIWVEETGSTFLLMAASRPRGGTWTAPVQVDTGSTTQDAEPSMAIDGRGVVVATWRDYLPGRTGSVIRTATLSGGAWSASQDLSPATTHAFQPVVAVDARGDAAIVWSEDITLTTGRHVAGAQRPVGGEWTTADVTTGPGAGAVAVAVAPDGRAVTFWAQDGTVQAADRALGSATWGAARQLSAGNGGDLDAVVDRDGDVIATWRSSGLAGASTIETVTLAANGAWGPVTTLVSTTTTQLAWQLDLGVGESGEALAAWVQAGDGNRTSDLYTAARTPGGTWSTTKVASPQVYNSSPTVGFGTGGASVVLWTGSTEQLTTAHTLYAVTRTPGHEWTPPTALASGSLGGPRVAVDPAGLGTLLWNEGGGLLQTQVFDGVAPSIEHYTASELVRGGEAATYSAAASDLWSAPTVTWQFDGRTTVAGGQVSRTFSRSGVHRVRLTATDAAHNTTTRDSVTVVATERPRLRGVTLSRSRLSYRLGAPALVRVQVRGHSGAVVATVDRALDAGERRLNLGAERLGIGPGRYTVRIAARNAVGRAVSARIPLRVLT